MSTIVKKMIGKIGLLTALCVICGIMLFGMSRIASAEEIVTTPMPTSTPSSTPVPTPIITSPPKNNVISRNYEYRILNEARKEASLVKVNNYGEEVELPSVIDGYSIVSIGIPYDDQHISNEHEFTQIIMPVFSEEDTIVKKLVIPEGVVLIETNAFYKMCNLETLVLPDSIKQIRTNNFMNAGNIKPLTFSDEISIWDNCFRNSVIEKVTVNSSVTTGSNIEDDDIPYGMSGIIKTLLVNNKKSQENVKLSLGHAHINKMVVSPSVKSIFIDGNYDNIQLKNSKTKIYYYDEFAKIKKITSLVSKVKVKKKSGKYIYSWSPMNIIMYYYDEPQDGSWKKNMKSKVTYKVQQKNKANKYKTIKTTKKTKINLKSKSKLKVMAVFSNK